eukprot:TRINITY_DN3631_c0_g1_i1.p1 TRINITY_DN3631_c0_g1~~TRINITY_DN3631_c0_g1_i1.p1  ORF type:complete len:124 (-),score=55.97 TRINITY_DN3631_c0_g1_i1:26-397(-)
MGYLRARLGSFTAGFAVATGASLYFLQRDLWASHRVLVQQLDAYHSAIEERLTRLETAAKSFTAAAAAGQDKAPAAAAAPPPPPPPPPPPLAAASVSTPSFSEEEDSAVSLSRLDDDDEGEDE